VQYVQAAKRVQRGTDSGLKARFIRDIGADGDGAIADQMRGRSP
jgi:hypothetical protein